MLPAEDLLDVLAAVVGARTCVVQDDIDAIEVDAECLEQEQRRLGPAHRAEVVAGDEQDAVGELERLEHALVDVGRRVDDHEIVRAGGRPDDLRGGRRR